MNLMPSHTGFSNPMLEWDRKDFQEKNDAIQNLISLIRQNPDQIREDQKNILLFFVEESSRPPETKQIFNTILLIMNVIVKGDLDVFISFAENLKTLERAILSFKHG